MIDCSYPACHCGTQPHFTFSPTKHFKPPSVATVTGEESADNISGLSSSFGNIQSVMNYPQMDTAQLSTLINMHEQLTSLTTTMQQKQSAAVGLAPTLTAVIPAQAAAAADLLYLLTIGPFQERCCKMSFSQQLLINWFFLEPPKSSKNNYSAESLKQS